MAARHGRCAQAGQALQAPTTETMTETDEFPPLAPPPPSAPLPLTPPWPAIPRGTCEVNGRSTYDAAAAIRFLVAASHATSCAVCFALFLMVLFALHANKAPTTDAKPARAA